MSEKIEPALTPEEWARGEYAGLRIGGTGSLNYQGARSALDQDDFPLVSFGSGLRHGIAALALHGQPLGFTWADVDALRSVAISDVPFVGKDGEMHPDVELTSIADRIEALLPPRETP